MTHRTALLLLGTAAMLASCATGAFSPSGSARPVGYSLFFLNEPTFLKLAYGRAESNDLGLMLECVKGTRVVRVLDVAASANGSTLSLASGRERTSLKISTEVADGQSLAMARVPSDAPVLTAFRSTGRLSVAYGRTRYALAANTEERGRVAEFFTACEGPISRVSPTGA